MDPQNASTRAFTGDRSPARAAVDNVLRRSLKISNPYDPAEVAKGLLARYRDEAERIKREQQGLPFSVMQAQAPVVLPDQRHRAPRDAPRHGRDRGRAEGADHQS